MLKTMLVAVAAVTGGLAASTAIAAPSFKCEPTVLQVPSEAKSAQFIIACSAADQSVAPSIEFAGEIPALATPPYLVTANYKIDARSSHAKHLNAEGFANQSFSGKLVASTHSVASLPSELVQAIHWDSANGVLSVQDLPGVWSIFSVNRLDLTGETLDFAGQASSPFVNGKATTVLDLGKKFSRFAGAGADQAKVKAQLAIRNGKIEVLVGETRVAQQSAIQESVLKLDKRPKDVTRAWQLAAQAKFLGLDDEVQYAIQKVAAHNPQLVAEFELGLARITSFTLDQPLVKTAN